MQEYLLFVCKPVWTVKQLTVKQLTVKQLPVDPSSSVYPSYWLPNSNTVVKTRTGTMTGHHFGVASDKYYWS